MSELCQNHKGLHLLQFSPSGFWLAHCVQLLSAASGSLSVEQLPVNAFDKYSPEGKRLLPRLSCKSSQIKTALLVSSFREPPDRTNNDRSLTMGLWRRSDPFLLPLVAAGPLIFTVIMGCLFSRLLQSRGRGTGVKQIKTPQSLLFLLRFRCFSWINAPQIAANIWLISGVLKKVDSDNFLWWFRCLYGGEAIQRSFFCQFCGCYSRSAF